MNIGLIGYGDLGRQIEQHIQSFSIAEEIFYFDDKAVKDGIGNSHPFDAYLSDEFQDLNFYVCLGYHHLNLRIKIIRNLLNKGCKCPSFIHPSSHVSKYSEIEPGCIIYPMANIDLNVKLGLGVIINNSSVISHDSKIEEGCYISPGVIVSGKVEIGRFSFIGSGCIISNGIRIGAESRVGIGSVITRHIPDGACVIGNPMRRVEKLDLI